MNNTVQNPLDAGAYQLPVIFGLHDIILNMFSAFVLGIAISYVYQRTHKGLSYSQSFMLTIVLVCVVVSMVVMVIGNNLARAFALVGALSIIRFRTVVKDTKDTAFIFLSLAAGMASGTSSYLLAFIGGGFTLAIVFLLHFLNYGSLYKVEFLLRFRSQLGDKKTVKSYSDVIETFSKSSSLINVEPSGDAQSNMLTYDVVLKKDREPAEFAAKIANISGVSEVVLVASKNDVDY